MKLEPRWTSKPILDPVLRDEADFANEDYTPHADNLAINPEMFRRYHTPSELWDWRQLAALLMGDVTGKDLLDMACGMGEESVYFAKLGAQVTAIDISEVGIASLKQRAAFHRLDITALEMRVDPTAFPDSSFDRIHGLGILHHVGIEAGLREVDRLLRPGGLGVFLEPIGNSTTVEAAKTFLMKHARFLGDFDHVTDHEHNLTWREVDAATQRFADVRIYPFHLLYRLKRFLPQSRRSIDAVRRFDSGLLALLPRLRHFAGGAVIAVRSRKTQGS
ncbi:MAG TPA: class I SAM-dependent methyltransferase [Kofleriaceae bacterium]|nr:class I SAM-dependent methyltransferase [Kofleriaceae bacterium]